MARWLQLGCATPDVAHATALTLGEQVAAHAHELGDDAPVIRCTLIPSDEPELGELRAMTPSSPVWALVAERPECVVIVAWYD